VNIPELLKRVPEFASLPQSEVSAFAAVATVRQLRRRHVLFLEGDDPAGFYLIESGWVKSFRTSSNGGEVVLDVVGPLEALGPCCGALAASPHACSAVALAPTTVVGVRGQTWKHIVRDCPQIRAAVTDILLTTRRRCVDLAVGLALHDIDSRLGALLLKLAGYRAAGPVDGPRDVPPLLSQQELASAVGTAREVVTRHIARLVENGVLGRRGRRIIVKDPNTLQQIVQTQ
jgi:CRP/FNR family transcriptional regulator